MHSVRVVIPVSDTLIKAAKGRGMAQTKTVGSCKHHFLSHPGLTWKELRTFYFLSLLPSPNQTFPLSADPSVLFPGETRK